MYWKAFTIQIVESNQGFAPLTTVYPGYARSGQVRNRIFHVKKQLFLKRFVNILTK